MSLLLDSTFTGSRIKTKVPYGQQLLARSDLAHWFQADAAAVSLGTGTDIARFASRKGTGGFAQATAANRALLTPDRLNGYAGAVFDGTKYYTAESGTDFDFSQPYTIVSLFRGDGTTGVNYLTAKFNSGVNMTALSINYSSGGRIVSQHGVTGAGFAGLAAPYTPGTYALAIQSHSANTLRQRVNGITTGQAVTDGAAGQGSWGFGSVRGANASGGLIGVAVDQIFIQSDILAVPGAALELVEKFFTRVYGLPFTPFAAS